MAKPGTTALTEEQKLFIVQRLAMHDGPQAVARAFKEEFGIEITRQHVTNYDHARGKKIGTKLRIAFELTRKQFEETILGIPIAQRSYRLRRLNQMHDSAFDKGNYPLAAQFLEQAAKEAGDVFTNITNVKGRVKHSVAEDDGDFSDDEARANLKNILEEAMRKTAPKPETTH